MATAGGDADPADAGMNPYGTSNASPCQRRPRRGGDQPLPEAPGDGASWQAPRVRGSTLTAGLGDVIAGAHLAATRGVDSRNAVAAFTNPGGIRDDIRFGSSGTEADGELTYGEAFGVQPFGNSLVTMTLTGAQIDALLEQQFDGPDIGYGNMLQVSAGFSVLEEGSERNGGIDLDALVAYFAKAGAVAPGAQDRITRLN